MRAVSIALFAGIAMGIVPAMAADGCGVGCHATVMGACVVDGWGTGAKVWNECPVTSRPRPPCGGDYVWSPRKHACFPAAKDWM